MQAISFIENMELEMTLSMIRQLIEQSAATRISFEWKSGERPTLTYTPTVAVEYVSVEFTVQNEEKNG